MVAVPRALIHASAADPRRGGRLWSRWVRVVTPAEMAGFAFPVIAAVLWVEDPGTARAVAVLVGAGIAEGLVLGSAQAAVLHRSLPTLSRRDWTLRTAAAAAVAWSIGLAPGASEDVWRQWPPVVQAAVAVAAGLVLLAVVGTAQWTVLRRHLRGSGRWIGWTAAGWLAGLSVFLLVASPLWQPGQPGWLVAAIGLVAGGGMALSMAAVTGWGLVRLLGTGQDRHRAASAAPVARPGVPAGAPAPDTDRG